MLRTRRNFLKTTLGGASLLSFGSVVPAFLDRTVYASSGQKSSNGNVVVVLQLSGGNDGLNTIVPYADDDYARHRATLRLSRSDVHPIDSYLGFHPEMKAAMELYQEGLLSIVQGVGYPNSSRDHAEAIQSWQSARPSQSTCQTGWIGRAIDFACQNNGADIPGVFVGTIQPPLAVNAEASVVPAIRSLDDYTLLSANKEPNDWMSEIYHNSEYSSDNEMLEFLRQSASVACEKSKRIEAVIQSSDSSSTYPPFQLAQTLHAVAQLIRADLGIQLFYAELGGDGFGGFDNHANQRDNHAALLRQLSESVSAFICDLKNDQLHDRVLLMTASEFGRTVAENGRRGTDHGAAAPMLLAGGHLKGGLIGSHPSLSDLDDGVLKHHTDFRQVYATVLDTWLGLDSKYVMGESFKILEMLI